MKKTLTIISNVSLFLIFVFISEGVVAQQLSKQQLLQENKEILTLNELSSKFNAKWDKYNVKNGFYLENGKRTKAPGWKIFKRSEWYWEQRINLATGEYPQTNAAVEYEKVKHKLKKADFTESWTNLGTNSSTGGYAGIGRINCVAFHPTDASTFWVGSPSGGIWRTTNGGSNWTILNNNETVLGVSDIAINSDYATSNTIYIATGDRDGGSMWSLGGGQASDNVSVGVYKSTDGGTTWTATGLTFAKSIGTRIYRLLIHPTNNNILFASVRTSGSTSTWGIYKSTDAGANWTRKTGNLWGDVEFKPGTPSTMYASSRGYAGIYFNISTDSGETWSYIGPLTGDGPRGELAVSANDPTVVYLLVANANGGIADVFKSTNSGVSFTGLGASSKSMLGYFSDGSGPNVGQGNYDLCIAASPTDVNTVHIGGVNTWKTTDGGTTWSINNMWTSYNGYNKSGAPVAHADKHTLVYQPGGVLFEGNDGGIYKTTDGGATWSDLSNGLVISQLYRIGVSQTSSTTVLTGLQDNGSKLFNTTWSDVKGGDGMECIIDYSNSNYMYATYVKGQISRSTNGGADFFPTDISANIPGGQPDGAWVTPYIIDPNNSSTIIAAYDSVWKSTDRGDTWTGISQELSNNTKLRSLAIAPSNSNVLYTADQVNMWKTTDGGATAWTAITLPPTPTSAITYIAVHPTNPNIVWITYGGYQAGQKVYESIDGGTSWTNISGVLPNLPVMSIVHYKEATDRNVLFIGTDLGVYVKDGSNNWAAYNSGLPSVVVSELEIYYDPSGTDKLRAGTYGRGLWETNIDAALPVELTSFAVNTIKGDNVSLEWETSTEVNNYGFEIERKSLNNSTIEDKENWEKVGFIKGSGNSNSPKYYTFIDKGINGGSDFAYRLKQLDISGQFDYSDIVEIKIIPNEYILEQNYPNPFNPSTKISYRLPVRSEVSLSIYNVLGKEVIKLVNEVKEAGLYTAEFDASNLSSGVYYYTLSTIDFSQTNKMMLVK